MKNKRRRKKKKTKKGNIVCITRGPWATPFQIVKSFLGWYKK